MKILAWHRFKAIVIKEFIQMRRDRITFALMIGVPIMQLILFGFAINTNPKQLPTVIVMGDNSHFTRRILSTLQNTEYFHFSKIVKDHKEAQQLLQRNKVQFIISIPENFTRDLVRGVKPAILVEADGSDPVANGRALASVQQLSNMALNDELTGPLSSLATGESAFDVHIHAKYNPLVITQYNIVPGLLGVVLTLTMVIITALAITRERERGTMENLLATPARPLEVMVGKILPYIMVGYVQVLIILVCARVVFNVPMLGSVLLLLFACLPFIAANLAMGLTFSTLAQNQLQAIQGAIFFFLPSLLLSGFMFPFRGMPHWAQTVGNLLPLTHFLVIVRGVILKGNTLSDLWPHIWSIMAFTLVVILLGYRRFRVTLD